ncbi:MAG: bifunctional serine/threonine-protein phosphatase/kinase [Candidatus Margulisiibacteriota bacterium]|jgi:serine/threonine protein phosphatase PrpC/serine/threonine protein kinase
MASAPSSSATAPPVVEALTPSPLGAVTGPVQTPQARINQSLEEARASVNRLLSPSFELQTIKLSNATFKEFFDAIAANLNTAILDPNKKINLDPNYNARNSKIICDFLGNFTSQIKALPKLQDEQKNSLFIVIRDFKPKSGPPLASGSIIIHGMSSAPMASAPSPTPESTSPHAPLRRGVEGSLTAPLPLATAQVPEGKKGVFPPPSPLAPASATRALAPPVTPSSSASAASVKVQISPAIIQAILLVVVDTYTRGQYSAALEAFKDLFRQQQFLVTEGKINIFCEALTTRYRNFFGVQQQAENKEEMLRSLLENDLLILKDSISKNTLIPNSLPYIGFNRYELIGLQNILRPDILADFVQVLITRINASKEEAEKEKQRLFELSPGNPDRIVYIQHGPRYVDQTKKALTYGDLVFNNLLAYWQQQEKFTATASALPVAISPLPSTNLTTASIGHFFVGIAHEPNIRCRENMEDTHLATTINVQGQNLELFAIFDGHGGKETADYLALNFQTHLQQALTLVDINNQVAVSNAIKAAFVTCQEAIKSQNVLAGSTAVISLAIDGLLYTANVGDARLVVINPDGRVHQCSYDQKPDYPEEIKRIQAADGFVADGRVDGILGCARSFGDTALGVHSAPDPFISTMQLQPGAKIVLACDGLWDVLKDDDVSKIQALSTLGAFSSAIQQGPQAKLAGALIAQALQKGSADNVSVIVAELPVRHLALSKPPTAPYRPAKPSPLGLSNFVAPSSSLTLVPTEVVGTTKEKDFSSRTPSSSSSERASAVTATSTTPAPPQSLLTRTPSSSSSERASAVTSASITPAPGLLGVAALRSMQAPSPTTVSTSPLVNPTVPPTRLPSPSRLPLPPTIRVPSGTSSLSSSSGALPSASSASSSSGSILPRVTPPAIPPAVLQKTEIIFVDKGQFYSIITIKQPQGSASKYKIHIVINDTTEEFDSNIPVEILDYKLEDTGQGHRKSIILGNEQTDQYLIGDAQIAGGSFGTVHMATFVPASEGEEIAGNKVVKLIRAEKTSIECLKKLIRQLNALPKSRQISGIEKIILYNNQETDGGSTKIALFSDEMTGSVHDLVPLPTAPVEPNKFLDMMHQMLTGVRDLHRGGFVDFDVKPANFLYRTTREGQTSFFLSDIDDVPSITTLQTVDFRFYKPTISPKYVSPEMVDFYKEPTQKKLSNLTAKSDIWSLGITFLELMGIEFLPNQLPANYHDNLPAFLKDELLTQKLNLSIQFLLQKLIQKLGQPETPQKKLIFDMIRLMLNPDPNARPAAQDLLVMFSQIPSVSASHGPGSSARSSASSGSSPPLPLTLAPRVAPTVITTATQAFGSIQRTGGSPLLTQPAKTTTTQSVQAPIPRLQGPLPTPMLAAVSRPIHEISRLGFPVIDVEGNGNCGLHALILGIRDISEFSPSQFANYLFSKKEAVLEKLQAEIELFKNTFQRLPEWVEEIIAKVISGANIKINDVVASKLGIHEKSLPADVDLYSKIVAYIQKMTTYLTVIDNLRRISNEQILLNLSRKTPLKFGNTLEDLFCALALRVTGRLKFITSQLEEQKLWKDLSFEEVRKIAALCRVRVDFEFDKVDISTKDIIDQENHISESEKIDSEKSKWPIIHLRFQVDARHFQYLASLQKN